MKMQVLCPCCESLFVMDITLVKFDVGKILINNSMKDEKKNKD